MWNLYRKIHHLAGFKLCNTVVVLVTIFAILIVELGHTNSALLKVKPYLLILITHLIILHTTDGQGVPALESTKGFIIIKV